jgi:hypothetical protein
VVESAPRVVVANPSILFSPRMLNGLFQRGRIRRQPAHLLVHSSRLYRKCARHFTIPRLRHAMSRFGHGCTEKSTIMRGHATTATLDPWVSCKWATQIGCCGSGHRKLRLSDSGKHRIHESGIAKAVVTTPPQRRFTRVP